MSGGTIRHTSTPATASTVARVAVAATVISVLGVIGLYVGSAVGAAGFPDDSSSAVAQTAWLCFSLGALVALVVGLVAWIRGRSRRSRFDVRAGQVAVAHFLVALALFLFS